MKKIILIAVLFLFCVCIFTACTDEGGETTTAEPTEATTEATTEVTTEATTVPEDTNYEEAYAELIDKYYTMISEMQGFDEVSEGDIGIAEVISHYETADEALSSLGYALKDIDGDDIPEFLLCPVIREEDPYGHNILLCYNLVNGEPSYLFSAWARSAYYVLQEGGLFYSGSNSAAESLFGEYVVSENKSGLEATSFYFSVIKDIDSVLYYRNNTGIEEPDTSEEISVDEFWEAQEAGMKRTLKLDLTVFSELGEMNDEPKKELSCVAVGFADDIVDLSGWDESLTPPYEIFKAYEGEGAVSLAFMQVGEIKDFKFYSLEVTNVDEDGNPKFKSELLYKRKTLSEEDPVIIEMCFPGTLPSYGFSYIDEEGVKAYSLNLSGYDSSLILDEIEL